MDKDNVILQYNKLVLNDAESELNELTKQNDIQENELKRLVEKINKLNIQEIEIKNNPNVVNIQPSSKEITYEDLYNESTLFLQRKGLLNEINSYSLVSEEEFEEITNSLNSAVPRGYEWSRSDFIVTFIAALLGCTTDIILSNRNNSFSGKGSKLSEHLKKFHKHASNAPIDYQGEGFGGGNHRVKSKGHDLLFFIDGIKMFKEGKFISGDVVISDPYQSLSLIESIIKYTQHMIADCFSPNSLPFPGYSILTEGNNQILRNLAVALYNNGFNIKNLLTQSLSVSIIEIIIRIYCGIESIKKSSPEINIDKDYSNFDVVKNFFISNNKEKLNQMMLIAHSIVATENISKVIVKCFMNDYKSLAEINLFQIITTVNYGWKSVQDIAKRNSDYARIVYHSDNVSENWIEIEKIVSETI